MKRIAVITGIMLISLAAIAAPGRPPGAPQGGPGGGPPQGAQGGEILPPGALAEFLGLTDAQKESGLALRETLHNTIEPLLEQQRGYREQIDAALAAGDAAKAGQLMLAGYNLGAQVRAAHEAFESAFHALLTSEQREKFAVYQELQELRQQPPPDGPRR